MSAERTLTVKIVGDGKDAKRAFNDVEGGADRMSSKMGAVGAVVAGAFAAAGAAAVGFGIKAVMAGSDLNETLSKSNTVFKGNAAEIDKWSKTAASSFGQSRTEALSAASTFGNMFVQLGTSTEEASKMSMQMTELASDFASFHNAAPTDVIEAMTAAFRGEYDAVQAFVPTINAAAVEEKALAMGLATTTKELTAQDKALATQKLLVEGAGDAMGDFDRTNDSLANRLRTVQARASDFASTVGTALMPAVLGAFDLFETLGPKVQAGFDVVKSIITDFFSGDIGAASNTLGQLFGLDEEQTATLQQVLLNVRTWIDEAITFIREKFGEIREWINTVMPEIKETISTVITQISEFWRVWGDDILNVATGIWTAIQGVISGVINVVLGIIRTVMALIRGDWGAAWEGIKQILSGVWEAIKGIVMGALDIVKGVIGGAWNLITEVTGQVWDKIVDKIKTVWWDIYSSVRTKVDEVQYKIRQVWEAVQEITSTAWDRVKSVASEKMGALVSIVQGLPGRIMSALGNVGTMLLDAGRRIIQGLIDGVQEKIGALKEKFSSVTNLIPDWKGPAEKDKKLLRPAGRMIMQGLIGGIAGEESALERQLAHVTGLIGVGGTSRFATAAVAAGTTHNRNLHIGSVTVVANDPSSFWEQLEQEERLLLPL